MSGKRIELPSTAITVGRKEGADILIQDPATSGRHCRLSVIVGQLVVEDLGSSNGTFVDEESVEEPQVVAVGSMVQVGNSLFKHEYRNKSEVEEEERLAGDLDKASRYVRSLLPAPLKTDRVTTEWRFIPSDKLGGDAFGYHWITDEKFAIYLVDVSGHGTAPALHSVAVLNLLSKQALPGVDFSKPADVLAALNRSFRMEDHGNMYFTLWYGIFDSSDRKLLYASAGHPSALLLSEKSKQRLRTPNMAIGLMEDLSFEDAEITVEPSSRLYVYSDGAFEVVTTAGEEWSMDEFLDLVAAGPAMESGEPERIEQAVRNVMREDVFEDDFSLLVARFT